MGFLARCYGLIADPARTFLALRDAGARAAVLPLVLLVIASAALLGVYYQWVNFDWLIGEMSASLAPEQADALADIVSPEILTASAIIGSAVVLPLMTAIWALYLFLVGKVCNLPERYGQWFAMVAWASMPGALILPLGLLAMAISDGRLMPDELNPLALNVVLGLPQDSAWRSFSSSLTLLLLLTLLLSAIGIRAWTGFTALKSAALAVAPYAVVFVTWAAVIVASSQW